MLARIFTLLTGLVFLVYGVIAALSPLPAGAPLAIIGFIMIAVEVPEFRPLIHRMRRRWAWFDRLVRLVAPRAGRAVRGVIEETDPARQIHAAEVDTPPPSGQSEAGPGRGDPDEPASQDDASHQEGPGAPGRKGPPPGGRD